MGTATADRNSGGEGGSTPALALVLTGPGGPQPVGRTPAVRVELRNVGPSEVWVVGVLDGSEEAIRYPHYRPVVTLDGEVVARPGPPEDPLVAPLRQGDFRRLAPGEGFDPTATSPLATFVNFRPSRPGTYRYVLTLETDSGSPEEWLSPVRQNEELQAVLDLVRRVPRLTVTSNPLEIHTE